VQDDRVTGGYVTCDPRKRPTLVTAHLRGVDGPELLARDAWDIDARLYKGRDEFGAVLSLSWPSGKTPPVKVRAGLTSRAPSAAPGREHGLPEMARRSSFGLCPFGTNVSGPGSLAWRGLRSGESLRLDDNAAKTARGHTQWSSRVS